ncbi:MAG: serine/threonine-protein kinase [Labilithrix sp.]
MSDRPTSGSLGSGDTLSATLPDLTTAAAPAFTPTRVAGRYELLGLLGSGGMGSVYRARDTELGEVVALKVLRRELLHSPEAIAHFRREVSLARRVTHRNVARTFDIGEHDGDRFLTMELVEGRSLGTLVETERLDFGYFLDLGIEVCRGLEAAHAAGVVHLDLKPDNVFLANDGRVVIGDFGIARAIGHVEARGVIAGTPAYMAPEQVTGDELDEATDIYALGAIFYEMLTGAPAWDGSTALAIASARLLKPPPDPRARREDVPEEISSVVVRCMARAKHDRYASVSDVRSALELARTVRPSASLRSARTTPLDLRARSIAVLPFRNRGDAADDYIADGFTEELIDALAGSQLVVRARGAVMPFRGTDRDPRDVGRMLGVDLVVEGATRRAGGMLHVNARVVGVEDGFHLWAQRFDVPEHRLLPVADEISAAAARAAGAAAGPRARVSSDEQAIDLLLRGRSELNKVSPEATRSAITFLERALVRLPNDPTILSAYAQAQYRRFAFIADDPNGDEAFELGERAARRALDLSPSLGDARAALASLHLAVGDGASAAREVMNALRAGGWTSPGVQDLHGRLLGEAGAIEEGLDRLRAAVAIDPSLERARIDIIRLQALRGVWEEVATADEMRTLPTGIFWMLAARLALWNPDTAWAADLEKRIRPLADVPQRNIALELLRVRAGTASTAELAPTLLARAQHRRRAVRGAILWRQILAEVLSFDGQADEALQSIEKAAELGLLDISWLDRCPLLQPLRPSERFQAAREQVASRARAVLAVLTA